MSPAESPRRWSRPALCAVCGAALWFALWAALAAVFFLNEALYGPLEAWWPRFAPGGMAFLPLLALVALGPALTGALWLTTLSPRLRGGQWVVHALLLKLALYPWEPRLGLDSPSDDPLRRLLAEALGSRNLLVANHHQPACLLVYYAVGLWALSRLASWVQTRVPAPARSAAPAPRPGAAWLHGGRWLILPALLWAATLTTIVGVPLLSCLVWGPLEVPVEGVYLKPLVVWATPVFLAGAACPVALFGTLWLAWLDRRLLRGRGLGRALLVLLAILPHALYFTAWQSEWGWPRSAYDYVEYTVHALRDLANCLILSPQLLVGYLAAELAVFDRLAHASGEERPLPP